MATAYKKPGVYIEEIQKFPPSVALVPTAVPAFVGYTEIAMQKAAGDLVKKPFRITSMAEYRAHFGEAQPEENIVVTVKETKDAGGAVALGFDARADEDKLSKNIMFYALQLYFANGGGPCYVVSAGAYADPKLADLKAGLDALEKYNEPTLLVFPEAQAMDKGEYKSLYEQVLLHCYKRKNRFAIIDVYNKDLSKPATGLLTVVDEFRNNVIGVDYLSYGAAYAPNLETTLDYAIDETKTVITYVAADGTTTDKKLDTMKLAQNRAYEGAKAAIRDLPCKLPPSPAVAGIYARVDNDRGVWKAPANTGVFSVIGPTIEMSDDEHEKLNVDETAGKSVNAIRAYTGRGTLVYGARTLAGNDNEWRYVNVRRLFIFIEESLKRATEAFVFEPNDAHTWLRVKGMCDSLLSTLWRQGALQGAKEEQAFRVSVGLGSTMTPDDILNGRLIVELALAPVRPAEFIILRFSHKLAES